VANPLAADQGVLLMLAHERMRGPIHGDKMRSAIPALAMRISVLHDVQGGEAHTLLSAMLAFGYAGPNRYLVVGNGLTRNGLPLYQHVADAILRKSICPDGEHDFGAVYDLFHQVVPGTVIWRGNKIALYNIG